MAKIEDCPGFETALLGQLTDRLGGFEHLGLCFLVGEAESHHPLLHGAEGFVDEGRTMSARPDTGKYRSRHYFI